MTAATPSHCWPEDVERALLIGRIWQPGTGPVLVAARPYSGKTFSQKNWCSASVRAEEQSDTIVTS